MKEINGCIETVLVQHFKLQLWHNHVKRLRKSLMYIDKSRLDASELEKKSTGLYEFHCGKRLCIKN